MKNFGWYMRWVLIFGVVCGFGMGCSQADDGAPSSHSSAEMSADTASVSAGDSDIQVPEEFQPGEERFNTFCARCHGVYARGTTNGPPLVHRIYEPSHHADVAFLRAAAQGVRAHHWEFGNMPKIPDASPEDVTLIIQYVRWLQREAGIR